MSASERIEKLFKKVLPAPFTIAVLLTFFTFLLAFFLTGKELSVGEHAFKILTYWESGIWKSNLMTFAMQMMLMLVLGHILALSKPFEKLIAMASRHCNTTANAAAIVCFFTIVVSLFNWGLGLIFGAIFARKIAEQAQKNFRPLNYPLIGAAAYSGLMVWHGGLSGSAPTKVSETGHLKKLMQTVMPEEQIALLPEKVDISATLLSGMNITVSILLLVVLPLAMYLIGKKNPGKKLALSNHSKEEIEKPQELLGAEKLDHSRILSSLTGLIIFIYACIKAKQTGLAVVNPNFINLVLLALALALHKNISHFLKALNQAISGASGILIQFPLYFGIMGIMHQSGLVNFFSDFFVSISNDTSFPIFTFMSAGLVNIFVPSGGGQWAVQGPIIIEASQQLGLPLEKNIMALAYGDQLTNMLQPFWALPLLGITGLKAREILPYTVLLFVMGGVIFVGALLLF